MVLVGNHFGGPPGPRKCAAAFVSRLNLLRISLHAPEAAKVDHDTCGRLALRSALRGTAWRRVEVVVGELAAVIAAAGSTPDQTLHDVQWLRGWPEEAVHGTQELRTERTTARDRGRTLKAGAQIESSQRF